MKKILSFIKKHRLWLTIAIALIVILIATPTFASMGHSGGGHISAGGGGHISGGGGGGGYSSSHSSSGDSASPMWAFKWIFTSFILEIIIIIFSDPRLLAWLSLNRILNRIKELNEIGHDKKPAVKQMYHFNQNMEISQFQDRLQKEGQQVWPKFASKVPDDLLNTFGQIYASAQFAYGAEIRNAIAGRNSIIGIQIDKQSLAKYMYPRFLDNMCKEIKADADKQSADDIVVSFTHISEVWQLTKDNDNSFYIVKITAYGTDNEYNTNSLGSTFKRQTWTDYVIFAKNQANEWKIDNLCYGEHFHLAGEDFNQHAPLAGTPDKHGWYKTGYTENDIYYD